MPSRRTWGESSAERGTPPSSISLTESGTIFSDLRTRLSCRIACDGAELVSLAQPGTKTTIRTDRVSPRRLRTCLLLAGSLTAPPPHSRAAAAPLTIARPEATCLVAGRYPRLDACIAPGDQVGRAQVRFRADDAGPWYAVEMTRNGRCQQAVLPRPLASTRTVAYFLDVADRESNESRLPEAAAEAPYHARVVARDADCRDLRLQAAPTVTAPPSLLVSVALDASGRSVAAAARQASAAATPPGFSADGPVPAPATGASPDASPAAARGGRHETAVLAATVAGVAGTLAAVKWGTGGHSSPVLVGRWIGPTNETVSSGAVPVRTCTELRTLDANQMGEYISGTITLGARTCTRLSGGGAGAPSSAAVVSFSGTSDAGYIQFTFTSDTSCPPTQFMGTLVGTTLSGAFRQTCQPLTEVTAWTATHVAGVSVAPSSTSGPK